MFFKGRLLFFLLFLGLMGMLFSGRGHDNNQEAYWQGYNAGLVAGNAEDAAPAPAPAPAGPRYRTGWSFFGFFPFLFFFFGLAFVSKLFFGRRHWQRHHGPGHHGRHGSHSRHWRKRHGRWGHQSESEADEKGPEDIDDGVKDW